MNQPSSPATGGCHNCGLDDRPFLHHINLGGIFRRLCTSCVLRANPRSCCPICFQIYNNSAAAVTYGTIGTVTCSKCNSSSHSGCVGPDPRKPYICPLCINHISPLFGLHRKEIDMKSASGLLAAAKISMESISKAAALAWAVAEKTAKEAVSARKTAKEALDHLAWIEGEFGEASDGEGETEKEELEFTEEDEGSGDDDMEEDDAGSDDEETGTNMDD